MIVNQRAFMSHYAAFEVVFTILIALTTSKTVGPLGILWIMVVTISTLMRSYLFVWQV